MYIKKAQIMLVGSNHIEVSGKDAQDIYNLCLDRDQEESSFPNMFVYQNGLQVFIPGSKVHYISFHEFQEANELQLEINYKQKEVLAEIKNTAKELGLDPFGFGTWEDWYSFYTLDGCTYLKDHLDGEETQVSNDPKIASLVEEVKQLEAQLEMMLESRNEELVQQQ